MHDVDVAVIGAGAAGMMCAALAGQRSLSVALLDHATVVGEKIRISGGGRCNFTNLGTTPVNFLSRNPHFCRSALARYTPQDFLALLKRHHISWHEKHRGQLFCDNSAQDIINLLKAECEVGRVKWRLGSSVETVAREGDKFVLVTTAGSVRASQVVIATGGLSIPAIGATDFGYRIARQFGLKIIEPRPALVPLTSESESAEAIKALAGVSVEVEIAASGPYGRQAFREDLLFTHRGLSGPAVLQASSYWAPGETIDIALAPNLDEASFIAKKSSQRASSARCLEEWLPKRLSEAWVGSRLSAEEAKRPVADLPDKTVRRLLQSLNWRFNPSGTEGFKKAEVTLGGVDTRALSSQSMEALAVPGLYFIGEVVDVTGWLGGYNFQWAWASAHACAMALKD